MDASSTLAAREALSAWTSAMRLWSAAELIEPGRRAEWERKRHEVNRLYTLWQLALARAVQEANHLRYRATSINWPIPGEPQPLSPSRVDRRDALVGHRPETTGERVPVAATRSRPVDEAATGRQGSARRLSWARTPSAPGDHGGRHRFRPAAARRRRPRINLHIAASLRILSEHLHVRSVSIDQGRIWIGRLAVNAPSIEAQLLVADLEYATGVRIAALAELTKKWLPKG